MAYIEYLGANYYYYGIIRLRRDKKGKEGEDVFKYQKYRWKLREEKETEKKRISGKRKSTEREEKMRKRE